MSPYEELTRFLTQLPFSQNACPLSFNEIERIVQRELPPSAKRDRTFWANADKRYYARFWLQAGWKVQSVDFPEGRVVFVRQMEQPRKPHGNRRASKREAPSSTSAERSGFEEVLVSLTEQEFTRIQELRNTANKAVQIVKKNLQDRHRQNVQVMVGGIKGADLQVVFQDGREQLVEVKGTSALNIAWSQLKVSSQQSYDSLLSGVPIYRVVGVDTRSPRILILKHGRDFIMEPEPRWTVKPARSQTSGRS